MQDEWEMALLVVSEMIQILDMITDRTILFDLGSILRQHGTYE
jgi:ABC-type glutathione transport system ATPase component